MVNTDLINDLMKLYKKYGNSSFMELSEFLKNQENIENFLIIINKFSDLNQSPNNTGKKKIINLAPKKLELLKDLDLEKFTFLNQLYSDIRSKHVLPTLRDIKFFREDNSLTPLKQKSWSEATKALINELSDLSLENLKAIKINPTNETEGLQKWTEIILNKKATN